MLKTSMLSSAALIVLAGQTAFASDGVGFAGAFATASSQFPNDTVLEIDRENNRFDVESFAQTFYRDIEISAATGAIIEVDAEALEPGMAALAAAYTADALRWPDAIALALNGPEGLLLDELELDFAASGQLVFDAYYADASGQLIGSIEFDAFTGEVVDSDFDGPAGPGSGTVEIGVLDSMTTSEAANPGFVAFASELEFRQGAFVWEVDLVNASTLTSIEVYLNAGTGEIIDTDASDENAVQIAANLAEAQVSREDAANTGVNALGGGFIYDLELERDGGQLLWEVDILFNDRRWEVEVNALTGQVIEVSDEGPAHIDLQFPANGSIAATALFSLTPGDANDDGVVDIADLNTVLSTFGTPNLSGDLNFDGAVDLTDLNILLSTFGTVYSN